ncbi:helix-turn-helix domain-containing protein [Pseudomonas sp. 5P_3.1_Bac2]|uniref:helix-turn-helix domain-containing protein n=1 Tax=Pseudomonas sp. 5P_3.1_Bac2 TaxID=2971617 RepID=UPI0021C5FCEB|nr:helix-turn-helix domain-containing protein [Pseudomonas sp. 5P_3.1_Bac2]
MNNTSAGGNRLQGAGVARHVSAPFNSVAQNANPNTHTSNSHCAKVLAHLLAGNRLTAISALSLFGCARLAARIENLRAEGWPIISKSIKVVNRDGKTVRVAEYNIDLEVM